MFVRKLLGRRTPEPPPVNPAKAEQRSEPAKTQLGISQRQSEPKLSLKQAMPEVETREERLTNPRLQGRFQENPDPDRALLGRAWELLEGYSHIPEDQIEPHVKAVRDKAWAIFPYGCIGRWRFLDLYLPGTPQYPGVLQRIKDGETFLDCGCCFGQALRQLAFDGAPSENLYGCDLRQEFIDLGYDLFKDKDTFKGTFVAGDMLDPDNTSLGALDGKLNIIHAASFFHLFGWEDQVDIGARIIRFFKPGAKNATLVGRQIGKHDPVDPEVHAQRGLGRYHHNPESLQKLWDEIGAKTGTKWKVEMAVLEESPVQGEREGDEKRVVIRYVVVKVDQGLFSRVVDKILP